MEDIYGPNDKIQTNIGLYNKDEVLLKKFEGDHPANMSDWIEKNKNDIDVLSLKSKFQLRFL